MVLKSLSSCALIAVLAACSTAPSSGDGGSSRNVLTRADLEGVTASNVYEVVRQLRPDWLSARGPTGIGRPDLSGAVPDTMMSLPNVYMSGTIVGGVDFLQTLDVTAVQELRYHDPARASSRFGMNNPRGVIEVILRSPDVEAASVDVGLAIGQRVGPARRGDLAIEASHGAGAPVMAPPLTTLG